MSKKRGSLKKFLLALSYKKIIDSGADHTVRCWGVGTDHWTVTRDGYARDKTPCTCGGET